MTNLLFFVLNSKLNKSTSNNNQAEPNFEAPNFIERPFRKTQCLQD